MMLRSEITVVTPELAAKWLDTRNQLNRRTYPSFIARYARDIRNGYWPITHQGIAFDSDGILLDGQHRLLAIKETGIPVRMLVTWDVPTESRRIVDTGKGRTVSDAARLGEGLEVHHDVVALVRAMELGARRTKITLTHSEVLAFYHQHEAAISFTVDAMPKASKALSRSQVRAGVARAYYHEDKHRLQQFAAVMTTGLIETPVDGSAITLRNFLLMNSNRSIQPADIYGKTQRAIKAFCEREVLSKIYSNRDELYPLPGEED